MSSGYNEEIDAAIIAKNLESELIDDLVNAYFELSSFPESLSEFPDWFQEKVATEVQEFDNNTDYAESGDAQEILKRYPQYDSNLSIESSTIECSVDLKGLLSSVAAAVLEKAVYAALDQRFYTISQLDWDEIVQDYRDGGMEIEWSPDDSPWPDSEELREIITETVTVEG
jgi:hypothetical protein